MRQRGGVVLLAWWFLAWGFSYAQIVGPFNSSAACETVRASVGASPALDPGLAGGGVSAACWSDAPPAWIGAER
jgi:hypothetical protein